MDRVKKFILWCLHWEREAVLESDVDYLATKHRIRIDREDIPLVFEILIRERLTVWEVIRIRRGEGHYRALVLTRSGKKEARLLPSNPHDIPS